MGNTVGVPASASSKHSHPTSDSVTTAQAEAERLFREKIGHISIVKNNKANNDNANDDDASGLGDLISSLQENTHSWASSVTSVTNSLGGSYFHSLPSRSQQHKKKNALEKHTNKSSKVNAVKQRGRAVNPSVIDKIEIQRRPTSSTGTPTMTLVSHSYSSSGHQSGESQSRDSKQCSDNSFSWNINNTQTNTDNTNQEQQQNDAKIEPSVTACIRAIANPPAIITTSNKIESPSTPASNSNDNINNILAVKNSRSSSHPSNGTMTEELLRDMQKKMGKMDLEQDSCMHQLKSMNQEMESYRRSTLRKLQEKDDTIDLNKTEIAFLKQQMLQVKMDYQDHKATVKTETRNLIRKITSLQNQLTLAELDRDAAVAAADAVTAASTAASTATNDTEEIATKNSHTDELKETVQDLLQQLEASEDDHQREQTMLHSEILVIRKKLERLESEYIAVERERDDARQQVDICQQQLDLEKALHASAEKHYQEEIQKWKGLYEQETRFTPQNHQASAKRLQKTAATLGSRLGAGILEGIQEEGNQSRAATAMTMNSSDDDSDAYYARLVGKMESVSAAMTKRSSTGFVQVQAAPMVDISSTCESIPAYVPESNSGTHESQAAFQETISIPNFLSKVW